MLIDSACWLRLLIQPQRHGGHRDQMSTEMRRSANRSDFILSILSISCHPCPPCLVVIIALSESMRRRGSGGRGFWRRGVAAELGQDALFLETEFLHDGRVGDGDFQRAASQLAGAAVARRAARRRPLRQAAASCSFASIAAVAALGDQLGDHVADLLRPPGVRAPLLRARGGRRSRSRRRGRGLIVRRAMS